MPTRRKLFSLPLLLLLVPACDKPTNPASIESDRREFSVRYLGEMRTPAEFADLTVASGNGELVKLGDVARVEPGPEDERAVTRYSEQPAVFIGVVRQSKANVLEVANGVHAGLPAVSLPIATLHGCPLRQSIVACPGDDEAMLAMAVKIA